MKTILTILFTLSITATALGQQIDTAQFKGYTACSDCMDKWEKSDAIGSPARQNTTDGGPRIRRTFGSSDNPIKQEGKKFIGQTLAIVGGVLLTGILISVSAIRIN